jgi:predicted metal-dependent hydrolase
MCQRTKWGNCSALGNLSFNWRLIMAPDFVLRYLVTHETVHLAIPDHSQRFWLTVQSLCPETERARQWLVANAHRLLTPLPL